MASFRTPLILAVLPLLLAACAGVKPVSAPPPREAASRTALKKELSTLNLSVEATSDDLGKTLNGIVPTTLYKGATKTKGLSAEIARNGAIAVSAADGFVYLTVPVSLSLSYGPFQSPPLASKLRFKLTAKVTPDWRIEGEIYYLGLSDLFTEEIGIGPLSLKPRGIVDGVTQPVQKVLSDAVTKKINEAFPLRGQVEKVWKLAQKPVLLDRTYSAWLRISPQEVMLSPLYAQNNRLRITVGLKSFAEVVVGPEPAGATVLPLPNLKPVQTYDRAFRVAVNADLYYRDLVAIASPLLLNRDLGSDGKSLIVKSLDIYGNGDRLVIKVETAGSLAGVFYLTGKPGVDPQTSRFSVEDVDFDLQTQDLLVSSADWFLHGTFRSVLQEKLNTDLSQRLEQSRELARKAVAQVELGERAYLKGKVGLIRPGDLLVQKDRLSVQLYGEGETAIQFR